MRANKMVTSLKAVYVLEVMSYGIIAALFIGQLLTVETVVTLQRSLMALAGIVFGTMAVCTVSLLAHRLMTTTTRACLKVQDPKKLPSNAFVERVAEVNPSISSVVDVAQEKAENVKPPKRAA